MCACVSVPFCVRIYVCVCTQVCVGTLCLSVNMRVCSGLCRTRVSVHTCVCTCGHECVPGYVWTRVCAWVRVSVCVRVDTSVCLGTCVCVCTCGHEYVPGYVCLCLFVWVCRRTHVYKYVCVCPCAKGVCLRGKSGWEGRRSCPVHLVDTSPFYLCPLRVGKSPSCPPGS